jgi:hypothetical protein
MSNTTNETRQVDSEKLKTARLALQAMGVKPEDLVTLPSISLELRLRLDYDPKDKTPVKVELIKVESVSERSDQLNLTIDEIRDFIKQKAGGYLTEVCTERYFGYKFTESRRRYLLLIEQRTDNNIAISIDKEEIENWQTIQRIYADKIVKHYPATDSFEIEKLEFLIYIYPTPEDDENFSKFIKKYKLEQIFNKHKLVFSEYLYFEYYTEPTDSDFVEMEKMVKEDMEKNPESYPPNDDPWFPRHENIIGQEIPQDLIDDLKQLDCISLASENSRFSYMQTFLIPLEYSKSFLEEFLHKIRFKLNSYDQIDHIPF